MRRFTDSFDSRRLRLALAGCVALAAWLVFLHQFIYRLSAPAAPAALPERPVEMRLVELAPAPAPAAAAPAPPTPKPTPKPAAAPPRPVPRHVMQAPAAEHHVAQESAQTAPPSPPATPTNATPMPAPAPAVAASSPEAAGSAARVIAQPLPVLPDELREDAFQAVAVARFDIHPDGTIDVQLVKSTPNPRLNQLLLEALHRWRFFPAMQGGRPVESRQDLRVHFNVE